MKKREVTQHMRRGARRVWNRVTNSAYGCAAGMLRALGQHAWSRYVLTYRALAVVRSQSALLRCTIEETQLKLKLMTDELAREQTQLDAATYDVRNMAKTRIRERKARAEMLGQSFTYRNEEVLVWMNDVYEIQRINEMRALHMKCKRLHTRVRKLHAAKHELHLKQAAFEDAICHAELADDFERITDRLDEANTARLDPLIMDILHKVYAMADTMAESADSTKELVAEMDRSTEAIQDSREYGKDVVDLVFMNMIDSKDMMATLV